MTKTTILAITALTTILILGTLGLTHNTFAQTDSISLGSTDDSPLGGKGKSTAKTTAAQAIPDWVRNNFEWYVNDQIDEQTLLTSMNWLFDQNLMHLSNKAAQEVAELRAENAELTKKLAVDGIVGPKTQSDSKEVELKNLSSKVDIRGWDPEKKEPIIGESDSQRTVDSINDFVDIFNNPDPNVMLCLPSEQNSDQSSCWIRVSQIHAGETKDTSVDVRDFAQDNLGQFNPDVFNPDQFNLASETIKELIDRGETSTKDWEDRFFDLTTTKYAQPTGSSIDDLQGIVVLCNVAMEKEIQAIQTEVMLLGELAEMYSDDTTDTAAGDTRYTGEPTEDKVAEWLDQRLVDVEQKIASLQTGVNVCEEKLASDDALVALQDWPTIQKKDLEEALHDTKMAIIRKIG